MGHSCKREMQKKDEGEREQKNGKRKEKKKKKSGDSVMAGALSGAGPRGL